mgnify:CR=1 FL=1
MFQCSSASRKFLNLKNAVGAFGADGFQCSSASRKFLNGYASSYPIPSQPMFQCSSASRKFLNLECRYHLIKIYLVSVLFSEPKIPQRIAFTIGNASRPGFSALQRAENSSTSSRQQDKPSGWVSVLFSEPKIPQRNPASRT